MPPRIAWTLAYFTHLSLSPVLLSFSNKERCAARGPSCRNSVAAVRCRVSCGSAALSAWARLGDLAHCTRCDISEGAVVCVLTWASFDYFWPWRLILELRFLKIPAPTQWGLPFGRACAMLSLLLPGNYTVLVSAPPCLSTRRPSRGSAILVVLPHSHYYSWLRGLCACYFTIKQRNTSAHDC